MSVEKVFLAVDLGASSGRLAAGVYDGETIRLEEVHRFPNGPVMVNGSLHWDALWQFSEIKTGIGRAVVTYGDALVSLGVDTWGVDYGLLDEQDGLIGNPFHYRDSRTSGMESRVFSLVPSREIYQITGIQSLYFNTLNQIFSEVCRGAPALSIARRLLFMPDLINFWLTGVKANERTIASTSQLLNPRTGDWARELIERLSIPDGLFGPIVEPGTCLGMMSTEVQKETGASSLMVVAPGCHDTASAVAAVPATGESHAYLSSGTWSLMGIESKGPIINSKSLEYSFSNEGGVCHTIRFLKNISGLWAVQECRGAWVDQGHEVSYDQLTKEAAEAKPFVAAIDPDEPVFQNPGDMPAKILEYCQTSGQELPQDRGTMIRVILESLALKYRFVLERLEESVGHRIETLHIVGGGTRNRLLNQFAASAINRRVVTGPVEATSVGNILLQMLATGHVSSLEEGRELVRRSFDTECYEPIEPVLWAEAYENFISMPGLRQEH